MAVKTGDTVRVITHAQDFTPSGEKNTGYGFGITGVVVRFRHNRFHGRQAVVLLSDGTYVDWTLTDIEVVR